ncbi:hypothetical protein HPL003_25340 [Paenibacillus terrae HPL-003]|uniref:DUF1540 domain-containing protein n=2 Tax=Paenibacillus terrae TaxID=159743 RepID=G7VPZ3_PAETH|nr:hypothetical protein HPL003_25340 [Paenibacillus terrae HPL-003]
MSPTAICHGRIGERYGGDNESEVIIMSQEAKPIVKCSVANCHYWGENNLCKADLIMIESDSHAGKKFDEEYAGESFSSVERDQAATSAATCCHTFKPKSL